MLPLQTVFYEESSFAESLQIDIRFYERYRTLYQ